MLGQGTETAEYEGTKCDSQENPALGQARIGVGTEQGRLGNVYQEKHLVAN